MGERGERVDVNHRAVSKPQCAPNMGRRVLDLIADNCFCRYQANTGRRKCILLLILLIVGLIIVLIYKPRSHSSPPPPANPSGLEGIGVGESKPGAERPGLPRPPALPIGDDEE